MKTRGQKALINTVALGVYQVVSFVCGLILPRYILTYFGSEYNGVTSSITHFLGFISILQVGIAGSTRFALYKVLANDDTVGISGIVNATEKYMRKVGMALLAYIGLMMIFYPYITNSTLTHAEMALLVFILGMQSFAQYFFGITYQILLTADQKQYIYNVIVTIATIINLVIAIVLMHMGFNIFIVKFGSVFIYIIVPIVLYLYVKRKYNIDKKVSPDKSGLKGRWDVMWHSVANIVHNNVGLVVLSLFADAKILSVYTVYYLVINGLYRILSIFTNSLEAAFGNMFAKKETYAAYKNLENYEFFTAWFSSIVFSCTLVLIVPFVKVYTHDITDVNYIEPVFAFLAVIAQLTMCIRQPYLSVVQAAGHYKQTRNGAFLEAGLNLLVTFLLTPKLGLAGVAIGTLSANLVRTLQYIFYLRNNIICRPVMHVFRILLWIGMNICVIIVVCSYLMRCLVLDNMYAWLFGGVVCFACATVITVVSSIVFYKSKTYILIDVFKKILFKKQISTK